MAVAGDAEVRHGIILAKNEPAKKYGIKTAEAIWQARAKCPNLVLVEAHYKKYEYYSKKLREMYSEYTDKVEPFGLDECWLDMTDAVGDYREAEEVSYQTPSHFLPLSKSVSLSQLSSSTLPFL